jgi:hypothetical protein
VTLPPEDWPRLKDAFAGARALPKDERPAYQRKEQQDSSPIHELGRRLEEARGLFADTDVRVLF